VLVFEDLHWIDTSTEEYLSTLIDSVAAIPLLLLVTYRVGYTPPFGSRSFHTTLTLRSLSEAESLAMAGRVLGSAQFPAELHTALMAKAEGVPLFIEEVTKTLLDLGVLRRENGSYRLVKGLAEVNVPDTIQAIIMARLDRLGENGKRTVQLASVIGRQFLVRLLERISGLTGELEGLLRELKALEIVYEQGLLPEPAYVFKHAVIQDVAYNSLLVQRRKDLHRAVGYAIEELYPDRLADHYEELAHHFAQGEAWQKAMHYSALAGDRAAHAYANTEASEHYARALEAAGKLAPAPAPGTLASLHEKRAAVLTLLAEYEAAAAEYQHALALVQRVGDRRQEIDILVGLSYVYQFYHKAEPTLRYINEALTIAREINDPTWQAACLVLRADAIAAGYGRIIEAIPDLEEGVRLSQESPDLRLRARALNFAARHLQFQGEFDRAIAYLTEGTALARHEHLGLVIGLGLFTLGHAYTAKGEYEEALRCYRELREYAEAAEDKLYMVRAPNAIGGVHLELYDLGEAIRFNAENDDLAQQLWAWPEPRGHSLLKLGLAYLYRDEHARAQEAFQRAWALLEEDVWFRWRWHIALLRALGEFALSERRLDEAWSYATQSLDLATQTDSRKHAARAQWLQGEVLAASGRFDEAAQVLAASVRLAESLQTPREVWLGKAALGKVLARLGREQDAEAHFMQAARTIEAITEKLQTPSLRRSFLSAEPVVDIYRTLGRRPPLAVP
jgi:tetratricopeptide (TPR) repeat protein